MENKTAMTHLIDKILRMPESNIKGFLNISGPAYIESEKEQIKDAYLEASKQTCWSYGEDAPSDDNVYAEEYYNKTYANDTTKGLPEEDSKRRAWHY